MLMLELDYSPAPNLMARFGTGLQRRLLLLTTPLPGRFSIRGGPHSTQHPVVQNKMVPERRERVQTCEAEQSVREIAVNILCRMKYRPVLLYAEIQLEQPKVEHAPVVQECDHTHDGRDE